MKILGSILMGIGILIAGLSGLCSLVFFVTEITSLHSQTGDLIGAVLMVGGIPFAIGAGLFFLGRHLIRKAGES